MIKVMSIFGTRPEAIKMAPVCRVLEEASKINHFVLLTAQHRQMLDQVIDFFDIKVDEDLNIMKESQSLEYVTSSVLTGVSDVIKKVKPDIVLVHGDTTTTFASALAAFYNKVPVGHVEAGLRTGDINYPFPEEANRRLTDAISTLLFAPTKRAFSNLEKENVFGDIYLTGNTIVDAVLWAIKKVKTPKNKLLLEIPTDKKILVATIHRRESWDRYLKEMCEALKEIILLHDDLFLVFPAHLNPKVRQTALEIFAGIERVLVTPPLEYGDFVWLLKRAYLILSDSGGIQEEAPAFRVPVVVLRDTTERPEAVECGIAVIGGRRKETIIKEVKRLLEDSSLRQRLEKIENPFGDGKASLRILNVIKERFGG